MIEPITTDDLFQAFQQSSESVHRCIRGLPDKAPELPKHMAANAAIGFAFNILSGHLEKAEDHLRDLRRWLKKVKEDGASSESQN